MNAQTLYSAPAQPLSPIHSDELINTLSSLLDELDVPHSLDLDSITNAAQRWRRKPGQERWEMPDIKLDDEQHQKVMAHLKKIGLVDELKPSSKHFEYALLLGATVPRMETRLKQLVKLWHEGVRFNQIVFLVAQRPLIAGIDQVDTLISRVIGKGAPESAQKNARPQTETEGARMVFEATEMPEAMRKIPVIYIDTPRYWNENYWQRANTRDTLKKWIQEYKTPDGKPAGGKTLVVSDQPHALYQHEVVRQELPESFKTEVTGEKAADETRTAIYLDALALWLHNLQKRVSANQ
ncbi:hypothetical protein GZ77_11885 [Endozoicomonas montiporae]|uniref:Uncharacterized protein n=2 Tax=Endozoicomonas montiporae TaxID=1027273 RepID=A0A081N918_9GAMM|nr:hypothetical protein [Endozoicomonas montiporae]KEQ14941.1 hypothetical protein GZ77_11885 [Endozoicomonas montiporae]